MHINPYKRASKSYRLLKKELQRYRPLRHVVINWGNAKSDTPAINNSAAIRTAINKINALTTLKAAGVLVPEFTTDYNIAKSWIEEKERTVVARKLISSSGGKGITIASTVDALPTDVKLYVHYLKKSAEYRVHVFKGKVIDYAQKRARREKPMGFNKYVCSYNNGWVFCRDNIDKRRDVSEAAIKAVSALGLDFGAVDVVVWKDKAYVLEVNTAPGLQGSTLQSYIKAFREEGYIE